MDKEDMLAQKLSDLAIELAEQADIEVPDDSLQQARSDFSKHIRKSLYQKKEEVLLEALERTRYADSDAYELLKETIEEASGVILMPDEKGGMLEVNAFAVPIFAHTTGGLNRADDFQDEEAFDLLSRSFTKGRLESPDAKVVLISHAYHLEEIDRIGYSQLNEMVHDAHASMTRRKMVSTPAIDRSIAGWPDNPFGPEDHAVELRFLVGFALKRVDDPFYQVPEDEAAADAYFAVRENRFHRWAEEVAPLVKRCLVTGGRDIDLNFLYQDLFHGAKERGVAEYYTLQMMSELSRGLVERGVHPAEAKAVMGPAEADGAMVLRVNLYATTGGDLLASSERPIETIRDLETEAADACDALKTIGIGSFSLAERFEPDGAAVDVRVYEE